MSVLLNLQTTYPQNIFNTFPHQQPQLNLNNPPSIQQGTCLDNKCLVACDPTPEGSYLMNMGAQIYKAAEEVDENVDDNSVEKMSTLFFEDY